MTFPYGRLSGHCRYTVHRSQTPQHHVSVRTAVTSLPAHKPPTLTFLEKWHCQRGGVVCKEEHEAGSSRGPHWQRLKASAGHLCTAGIVEWWLYFFHELWRNLFLLFTCLSFLIFHKIGIHFKNYVYGLFCLHVWLCTCACLVPVEVRAPGTGATESCKPPYDWELNLGPLKYQKVLFITEPFSSLCEAVTLKNYFKQIMY